MIGDTAMIGAMQPTSASRTPGMARIGSTLMTTMEDREALARIVVEAAATLRRREMRGLRHRRTP